MYETALEMANSRVEEITFAAIKLIKAANLQPESQTPLEVLMPGVTDILRMQLRYLETGDVAEWREYIVEAVTTRMERGADYANSIKAGQCIADALNQFFVRLLTAPDTSETLKRLQRRIGGLGMVASTTVTAIGLKRLSEK